MAYSDFTISRVKKELGMTISEVTGIFDEVQAIKCVYGVVTTGTSWLFMRLTGDRIQLDDREYFLNEVDLILGILMLPFQIENG